MVKDRFLASILIGIGVLVIAALVLFFVRKGQENYLNEDSPAAVLHDYVLALQQRDYDRAYGYLADSTYKPGHEAFQRAFLTYQGQSVENTSVDIGEVILRDSGQTATVAITILQGGGDPFTSIARRQDSAWLTRQNGDWKVGGAPYPFWGYEWQTPSSPALFPPTPTPIP